MPSSPRTFVRRHAAALAAFSLAAALIAAFALVRPAQAADHAYGDGPSFVVTLAPDHGPAGSTFRATLTITGISNCRSYDVAFYLDGSVRRGQELAPVVAMPHSCRASTIVRAPSAWRPGDRKHIVGTYAVPFVPPHESGATFTVDGGQPTASPSRSHHAAAPSHRPKPSASARRLTPSASPSSPDALGAASPEPSFDLPLPIRQAADVGPARSRGPNGLLIAAALAIVVVGTFGGWAAHRQRRLAELGAPRDGD